MSSNSDLLSHVTIIRQIYMSYEFSDEALFERVCKTLQKSKMFKSFQYPDKYVFSLHYRETGETFRTFERKESIKVLNLDLINTKLIGEIRVITTLYRAGFVVLSLVYSVIPKKKQGSPVGKNLISESPLTPIDIVLLIEDQIPLGQKSAKYKIEFHNDKTEMTGPDLVEYLLKDLKENGIVIIEKPKRFTKVVILWNPNLSAKSFSKILEENCKDLLTIFTTPEKGTIPASPKKTILKKLKTNLHWYSKNRGFLFDSESMLIIAPRKASPHCIIQSPLSWIFQLVSLEDFMLKFYSKEVRRLAPKMVFASATAYSALLDNILKLRAAFSLGLEDIYWVETDLFRIQSATLVAEYKRRFKLEEKLANLEKRFSWIQERCMNALTAYQQKTEKTREKSITNLTLIFATFGLGEIVSTLVVWYFGYLQTANQIPVPYVILGSITPFALISVIYLISRWYVNKKYKEEGY